MLVLRASDGDTFRIRCPDGTVMWITLARRDGRANRWKLIFDAPLSVSILREDKPLLDDPAK